MIQSRVPKRFWSQSIQIGAHISHQQVTKHRFQSHYLKVFKRSNIEISHLRVFLCTYFVQVIHRGKVDPRETTCMLFDQYSSTEEGYKCYN